MRFPLTTQWEEASQRTRRRHLCKANQAVDAVLEEVAPNQSGQLWKSLVASKSSDENPSGNEREPVDEMLMEALAECYRNASNWQPRRQILSIMADKIPNLTRYQFREARKHILVEGRGVALSLQSSQTRMAVSQTQLDHFLDFITSTHVIQDLPFAQKSIKLSTKEVIRVLTVIRMMVPESIVKQYFAYSSESGFTTLSRTILLRILNVCAASVRKSLQGLDYISCASSQAFEDVHDVVNRLGDSFMGMTWARKQKERLKSGKRYLKGDFNVNVSKQSNIPDHCRAYALSDPRDKDY
ncbi:unnamed protein product [Porites lobata]|uniref:Uncharacterized protein n=1 Tax=Porites lobata TaxID=104759 RepID=A0ABN8QTI0_9CNID|nr:unnamed protein product [Porites lobata]